MGKGNPLKQLREASQNIFLEI